MGFVKDAARIGTFGLAGLALGKKKKKTETPSKIPSMISTVTSDRPSSTMIGSPRIGSY